MNEDRELVDLRLALALCIQQAHHHRFDIAEHLLGAEQCERDAARIREQIAELEARDGN